MRKVNKEIYMCIFRNRWKDFEPTTKYLSVVSGLTSVTKLHNYLKQFTPKAEKAGNDYWKTPIEFIENKDEPNDCEDFSRFAVDVLARIIGIKNARFVIHSGYNKSRWGSWIWNMKCHAIAVFLYKEKFAVFSNNELIIGYKDPVESKFIMSGYLTFPDGLKYMEIRNWQGKVLSRKWKLFGTF